MNGRDHTVPGIADKDRHTVGRSDSDCNPGQFRNKSVVSLQVFPRQIRPVYDCDLGTVYLVPLDDGIRKDGIAARRKGLDSGT